MARLLLAGAIDSIQCSWVKLGDDGTHGLEKYSRRRTAYVSWREDTAADLMPAHEATATKRLA